MFQSTPAHGGRHATGVNKSLQLSFNPRPRTAGDLEASREKQEAPGFQSTPAHGGRQSRNNMATHTIHVSIHARARRATA